MCKFRYFENKQWHQVVIFQTAALPTVACELKLGHLVHGLLGRCNWGQQSSPNQALDCQEAGLSLLGLRRNVLMPIDVLWCQTGNMARAFLVATWGTAAKTPHGPWSIFPIDRNRIKAMGSKHLTKQIFFSRCLCLCLLIFSSPESRQKSRNDSQRGCGLGVFKRLSLSYE